MMTRMFEPQLGRSIEVYIDDMVVKSKVVFEYMGDLKNIFEILRKHKLRLNASKCSFDVGSGKFLASKSQGSPEANRNDCCLKPVYLSINR